MSIINSSIVYRVAGDRKMAAAMADTLIAQDNSRLRAMLLDTTNMLRVYRDTRACTADRRLSRIADKVNAPISCRRRLARFFAACVLVPTALLAATRANKKTPSVTSRRRSHEGKTTTNIIPQGGKKINGSSDDNRGSRGDTLAKVGGRGLSRQISQRAQTGRRAGAARRGA